MAHKVLVPIDLADMKTGLAVLREGVAQTKVRDGELTVMTVVPDLLAGLDYRYAIRGETGGSEEFDLKKVVAQMLERLNEVVEENTPDGMEVATLARHGSAYEQILDVAERIGADQIVVGAHKPNLSDYLLGTTSARVVRHAKCSVSVVRT